MRHGYYLAATGEMLGDVELAKEARDLWHSLVLPAPVYPPCKPYEIPYVVARIL